MENIVKAALDGMSSVKKPQKTFIALLLSALIVVQGKANFRNMSRYSPMSEKRFSRWSRRSFDFSSFNCLMLSDVVEKAQELIAALDASFMTKSGKKTDGLGMFWRGCTSRSERGLELSLLSVIDLQSNTAYALDAEQTLDEDGKTRVDLYAEQVIRAEKILNLGISYLSVDAYYFKEKFVSAVVATGLQIVGKLRNDADLLWLYTGSYSGSGRPRIYDGKVNPDKDLHRFEHVGQLESGENIYTAVHSKCLKRRILLRTQRGTKMGVSLLYSTQRRDDNHQMLQSQVSDRIYSGMQAVHRVDGRQSCRKECIHTQINAFTALNA